MPSEIVPSDVVRAIQESVETKTIDLNERRYVTRQVFNPPADALPQVLEIHTLSGLCDFVKQHKPAEDIALIHVCDEDTVHVCGNLEGFNRQRPLYARAHPIELPEMRFGRFQQVEDFIIWLQTAFIPSEPVGKILSIVGNLRDENVQTATDDGVTQTVTTRKGVALGQQTTIQNPYSLAPIRSFSEIQQPESPFILRLKQQEKGLPLVGLFEVGDGKWRLEAISLIFTFIEKQVGDITILA